MALFSFFLRCMCTTTATRITTTRAKNMPTTTHDTTMGTRFGCGSLLEDGVVGNSGVDVSASKHKILDFLLPIYTSYSNTCNIDDLVIFQQWLPVAILLEKAQSYNHSTQTLPQSSFLAQRYSAPQENP